MQVVGCRVQSASRRQKEGGSVEEGTRRQQARWGRGRCVPLCPARAAETLSLCKRARSGGDFEQPADRRLKYLENSAEAMQNDLKLMWPSRNSNGPALRLNIEDSLVQPWYYYVVHRSTTSKHPARHMGWQARGLIGVWRIEDGRWPQPVTGDYRATVIKHWHISSTGVSVGQACAFPSHHPPTQSRRTKTESMLRQASCMPSRLVGLFG